MFNFVLKFVRCVISCLILNLLAGKGTKYPLFYPCMALVIYNQLSLIIINQLAFYHFQVSNLKVIMYNLIKISNFSFTISFPSTMIINPLAFTFVIFNHFQVPKNIFYHSSTRFCLL